MMRRVFGFLVAAVSAGGMALCGLAFYFRYWRWLDCFNELGRCYDPESQEVFLEQAGIVWGGLALMCLGAATIFLLRALRLRPT